MTQSTAVAVVDILRAFLFITIGMIYLPAVAYSVAFGKFGVLW
jgi:hypothetical protein